MSETQARVHAVSCKGGNRAFKSSHLHLIPRQGFGHVGGAEMAGLSEYGEQGHMTEQPQQPWEVESGAGLVGLVSGKPGAPPAP